MEKEMAVIFDMDGVIVDSNPYHKVSLHYFVRRYGHFLSETDLRERVYGRTNKEWITNVFGKLPPAQLKVYADEKEGIYREMYRKDLRPTDGLVDFLQLLDQYKIPRAIATSAPVANVAFTLNGTGIRDFFPVILDESFVEHGKPNPEIYLKASAALNKKPSQCVVIEDSLSGITAARAAGCKVVGITTTHTPEELSDTDFVIKDFKDLDPYVLFEKVKGVHTQQ